MTNEFDELIWRVLDGKASSEEICGVKEWVQNDEHKRHFKQLQKFWNVVNGPHVSFERKQKELIRFQDFMRKHSQKKERTFVGKKWYRNAAVWLIPILSAAFGVWHEFSREYASPFLAETGELVSPGMPQAVLTISGGDTIVLQPNRAVDIQLAGQVRVVGSGESIVYELDEGESPRVERYNTLATPVGGEYQVELSDGSKVWLNSLTKLRYPEVFKEDCREVYLTGEAYFEVKHDAERPFVVVVDGMKVAVYGTRFNVNTYHAGVVQTVLVDGKVGVQVDATGKEIVLHPNEMATYSEESQQVNVKAIVPYVYTAWKDGKFVFDEEPVEEIMKRLSRWYGIKVVYKNEQVKEQLFTGIITRYAEVKDVLHLIEETALVHFYLNGNVVTVSTD